QEDAHHPGREELDREQVRPGHDRVVGFLLDADDGILLDEREQPIRPRRHRHPLLVDLRPPGWIDGEDDALVGWRLCVSHGSEGATDPTSGRWSRGAPPRTSVSA